MKWWLYSASHATYQVQLNRSLGKCVVTVSSVLKDVSYYLHACSIECWKQDEIDVNNAWAIFQSADRFQLKWIRQKSKDKILIEAKEAFKTRPLVKQELLDEVLGSNLLCIKDQELFDLLSKWTDAPDQSGPFIRKWVSLENVQVWNAPDDLVQALMDGDEQETFRSLRKRGEHTVDLISCVKERFSAFVRNGQWRGWRGNHEIVTVAYLTNWVCVSSTMHDLADLAPCAYELASGLHLSWKLRAGQWLEWRLPTFAVHLLAVKFTADFKDADHLEVFCAEDCAGWQRVFSSKDHDGIVKKDTVVPCVCEGLVQRFKVQMISGEYPVGYIKFEGILREL